MPCYYGSMSKRSDPIYQAQAILSRRDHSVAEVKQKLARQGFSPEQETQAINWLVDNRLLDDTKFAAAYVTSILGAKPVGRRYLTSKLKQKGVAGSIIQKVLAELVPPERETELAEQAAARWARVHPQHATDKNRLLRFLLSRGFMNEFLQLP